MAVNPRAGFLCTKYVPSDLKKSKGKIVNIGSPNTLRRERKFAGGSYALVLASGWRWQTRSGLIAGRVWTRESIRS